MRQILFAVLLIAQLASAQTRDPLIFRDKVHDFGDIVETKGHVEHEFVFSNNSGRPVKILSVNASCGCTTPGWSREPVPSGKTGFVQVSFDPKGRPGYFNKTLSVLTDLDPNPIVLQIKGQVVQSLPVETDDFQVTMGRLRFKTRSFNMGTMYLNQDAVQKQFAVMNSGVQPIRFLDVEKPAYVRVEMPATLAAGEKGTIKVTYDARLKNKFGFSSDNLLFTTDDPDDEKKSLSLFATVEEFYPPLTPEETLRAPQALLREQDVDLGRAPVGATLERKVTLVNKGRKELRIKALQGNCACISADMEKRTVRPGDSTYIKIIFKPQSRGGTQQKAIAVYTNDPRNPVQWLSVLVYMED